jgi:hypothetical protein
VPLTLFRAQRAMVLEFLKKRCRVFVRSNGICHQLN